MKNLTKWTKASNYCGTDFSKYYLGCAVTRDSCLIEQSNFESALELLGGETKRDVIVSDSNHWACGWVKQILVHEKAKKKLKILLEIRESLENYGVLNDDDYLERENEYRDETFDYYETEFQTELRKYLKLDNLDKFPAKHVRIFLSAVYEQDCGYCGAEDAYVCEASINRFVDEYEFKQLLEDKNKIAILINKNNQRNKEVN